MQYTVFSSVYKLDFRSLKNHAKKSTLTNTLTKDLRTFTPNFSNIDFFLEILPLKDDELVMSEM